jgi:endoglucanase
MPEFDPNRLGITSWIRHSIRVTLAKLIALFGPGFLRDPVGPPPPPPPPPLPKQLRGANRAGAEYGSEWDGWTGQTYYEWPKPTPRTNELNHFDLKSMNVVRLPISWERLQHTLNGPLNLPYKNELTDYVNAATTKGFSVVIDLHNYGRYAIGTHDGSGAQLSTYTQHRLGDGTLTFAHVVDVWTKIASLFVSNPRVIFNLMNEQHDADPSLDSKGIFDGYQTVLNAVRATGAKQLILFPNTRKSDVNHWDKYAPQQGLKDSIEALNVTDTANNFAFDMHSYTEFDDWNNPGDIQIVTNWAKTNNKRLFLSELGAKSQGDVDKLLLYINANSDVWVGWTVWNLEPYSITVTDNGGIVSDTAKMSWYAPYFP